MTDQRREQRTYPPRSAYMSYLHTTSDMVRKDARHRLLSQLDDEIRRDEAMMLKRVHDSRMKTEKAIQEIRLEQERRLIKEEQKRQEHEERKRIRRQNREQLERELARIKHELRAELVKEDIKRQKAEEESEQPKEIKRKRLASTHEREVCLIQTECIQPAVELKAQEQKQIINDNQLIATGQENEIMQDETEEEQRNVDVRENENRTRMEQDERTDEERRTEVQTDYSDYNSNTDLSSNNTVQRDYTCSNVPYGQLNISCAQITALEVRRNTDRQEMSVDQTLEVCIAQECVSVDIVQSEHAHANLSDEQLQISGIKIASLKVHHDTDLQKKVMQQKLLVYIAQECASDTQVPQSLLQLDMLLGDSEVREIMYAESRDIVLTCKNMCLCFKFLWWQEGTLSS